MRHIYNLLFEKFLQVNFREVEEWSMNLELWIQKHVNSEESSITGNTC